jgi:hypothetical protein
VMPPPHSVTGVLMLSSRHLPHPSLTYRCCGLLLPGAVAVLSLGRYHLVIRDDVIVHRKFEVEAVSLSVI